jgi:hypothetical protein
MAVPSFAPTGREAVAESAAGTLTLVVSTTGGAEWPAVPPRSAATRSFELSAGAMVR